MSKIGTVINGAKYTFNIAKDGNYGYIGYINLTKGTWIVFAGGWNPCTIGYVEIENYYYSQGWKDGFTFVLSGIVSLASNTTVKIKLTNWGDTNATNWAGGYVRAIMIT